MIGNHSFSLCKKWLLCLVLGGVGVSPVMAGAAGEAKLPPVMLAMGDIGPLKNDLAPTDPSANVKWSELTEQQRSVLSPLGLQWDGLRPWQREKMLDIAREYPKMDAQKKQRIQQRLVQWSRMTPYERENARKRYQQFQSLNPEKKEALRKQWQEHQKKSAASEGYDPEFDGVEP